ncbi:MAG TPA: M12 family metallopeptidase [Abditibacteriaceae bacterium]|jgi:hypothetical protein
MKSNTERKKNAVDTKSKGVKKPVKKTSPSTQQKAERRYCGVPVSAPRTFGPEVGPPRAELIQLIAPKWVNGTVLNYWFFAGPTSQKAAMRRAFKIWENVGIGIKFKEVTQRQDAQIRIAFATTGPDAGSWSYIGREILTIAQTKPTMNIGWDVSSDIDTAVHEIGHTLGFPHEHQNPNAGIVWNEEAVYAELGGYPNYWEREKTYWNIIRKIAPDTVQGSNWDPNSIMHYPFGPGLISQPAQFQVGLQPAGGLSARDVQWVKTFYPPLTPSNYINLPTLNSVPLKVADDGQANYVIKPDQTRFYEMRTFGESDSVMVLFEEIKGALHFVAGDDDSGTEKNAYLRVRLRKGQKYVLRVRVMYVEPETNAAIMLW